MIALPCAIDHDVTAGYARSFNGTSKSTACHSGATQVLGFWHVGHDERVT
jgi:hypothetical protein